MELFDTYFVWFGQLLAVSGMKTLVISPLRQEAVSVFRFEFNSALLTHCLVTVVPRAFPLKFLD